MGVVLGSLRLYDRWAAGGVRLASGWAVTAVVLFSGCCLVSRRLHDRGRAGWWTGAYLALFLWAWLHPRSWTAALLALLAAELCLAPGQRKPNRFGPPLGR